MNTDVAMLSVVHYIGVKKTIYGLLFVRVPATVAERSKACTVFAHSETGIVGPNSTQGMDVWYVYVFILCLCCPVFRQCPYDDLITRPRSPTAYKMIKKTEKSALCSKVGVRGRKKICACYSWQFT
jgi:hypothetical protein